MKEEPGKYATERTSIEEKQCGEIRGPLSPEGMHELEPPYQNWLSGPLAQPTYFLWKKEQPRCARAKDNHSLQCSTQEPGKNIPPAQRPATALATLKEDFWGVWSLVVSEASRPLETILLSDQSASQFLLFCPRKISI